MVKVTINENLCKGCGLCARACPKGCIELSKAKINAKGYHPAEVVKLVKEGSHIHRIVGDARRVIAFGRGNDFAGKVCDMTDQFLFRGLCQQRQIRLVRALEHDAVFGQLFQDAALREIRTIIFQGYFSFHTSPDKRLRGCGWCTWRPHPRCRPAPGPAPGNSRRRTRGRAAPPLR